MVVNGHVFHIIITCYGCFCAGGTMILLDLNVSHPFKTSALPILVTFVKFFAFHIIIKPQ